jgi:hypothetical protein
MMAKRITMVGAVDSDGNSFLKLSLAVSNTTTTLIALAQLIKLYDEKDPNWKSKSVVNLDGASYHRSKDVEVYLSQQGVKFIIQSPNSP